jgi:predicted 2-oxoglutarate/Fe(II)-dependent dioxygenase YbiX
VRSAAPGIDAIALLPGDSPVCWLFPDFLSPSECDAEIASAQARGFVRADADFPPSYRNNRRLVLDDPSRSEALYARLLSRVTIDRLVRDAHGRRWRPTGVNPRLRYCRYEPGEAFHLHQDGVRHERDGRRSWLTFMIYLDDPDRFEGGETRFFAHGPEGDANGDNPVLLSLRPPRGSLIVFDHGLWHDGAEVLAGVKHVLRSDLLFAADDSADIVADCIGRTGPFTPGHDGYVWKLAALGDGGVASAGRDAIVRLWSDDGAPRGMLVGHTQSILAMAQTSTDTLYTLSRDRTLRCWDLHRCIQTSCSIAHAGAGLALVADTDESLISGGADGALRRWRRMDAIASRDAAHAGWIWDLALHVDTAISVGEDGFARIWRREDLSLLATLPHPHALRAVAVRSDAGGIALACGDMYGHVHLWHRSDGHDWRSSGIQTRHRAAVRALRLLPDGRLGSAGEDGCILVGGCTAEEPWHEVARHANFATDLLAFHDGRLLSAGYDGSLRVGAWSADHSPTTDLIPLTSSPRSTLEQP